MEVLPHLIEAWNVFHDLSPGRPVYESGEGFISAQEVEAYCRLMGLDDVEDRLDLFRMVRAMDGAYLKERARQRDRKREEEKQWRRGK